jgi:hypothetical protein
MKINGIYWITGVLPFVIWGLSSVDYKNKFSEAQEFRTVSSVGVTNAQDRMSWELERLVDPVTNKIPENIRQKELIFASQLPSDKFSMARSVFWSARGPYNVGGRTRAFAEDIRNESVLIAGGVSGGVWRSTDGGDNWYKTTPSNDLHSTTCIIQDLRIGKNDTWYLGTGELLGNSASAPGAYFYGNGIYKSTDNGITWQSVASTASNTPAKFDVWDMIWNIQINTAVDTADIIYAATYTTIYRSADGGQSWQAVLGGDLNNTAYYTDVAITSTGVVYAYISSEGKDNGIWRSVNGTEWTKITPSTFPAVYQRMVFGINSSNENEVYILGQTPNSGKKTLNYYGNADWNSLWKYTYLAGNGKDSNGLWINLSNNIPSDGTAKFGNFQSQGGYDVVVSVKPDEPNVVFIGGTNLYRSTDGFSTPNNIMQIGGYGLNTQRPNWKLYPNSHPDHHVVFFSKSNPDVLYNGNDGGLYRTSNCMEDTVVWDDLNTGYLTTQTYAVGIDPTTDNDIIVAGFQDNGNRFTSSPNPLSDWGMPLNGDGSFSAIAPDSEYYVLSTQNGRMQKMKIDPNGNRIKFARIDPIGGKDYQFINPFVLDPNNKNLLYLAGGKVLWRQDRLSEIPLNDTYDSISFGWQAIDPDFLISSQRITALAVSTKPANRLYFGLNRGFLYRVDNVNTGIPVPVKLNSESFSNSGNISCVAIDPRDADKVIVVISNYNVYSLYYSTDGGAKWLKVAGNLEEFPDGTGSGPSLRWISILPYKGKTLYCLGTSVGLFATDTLIADSTTWKQLGASTIGNVVVEMVTTREKDGLIIAATHGNGIYSTRINSVDEILSMFEPSNYISQNVKVYPNPASDYLFVDFTLFQKQYIEVFVYDQSGRILNKPFCGTLLNGQNQLKFITSQYKSGTYYLGIKSEKGVITRKFVKK